MRRILRHLLTLALLSLPASIFGQTYQNHLHVQSCTQGGRNWTAADLVQNILVGQGVQVSNVMFNGSTGVISCDAIGTFHTDSLAPTTRIGLREGILITTSRITGAPGPNREARDTIPYYCSSYSDSTLAHLPEVISSGRSLTDCSVLEFDFIPQTDSIGFRYVFASEEYPWLGETYNDIFAFFVSGPKPGGGNYNDTNIAKIPGTTNSVGISTVNNMYNSTYYIDNNGFPLRFSSSILDTMQIEYDGFTTVLTAFVNVIPCSTYHLRLSISDVGDYISSSGVFLEAGSLSAKSVDVVLRTMDSTETSSHTVKESCCLDMVVRLLNPNSQNRTLKIFHTCNSGLMNASTSDFTITPNISGIEGSPSSITFPIGQDSLVFRICATQDGMNDLYEKFRIAYKLDGDCQYRADTFLIDNTNTLLLTSSLPVTISEDSVALTVNNTGGVQPLTYTWIDRNSGDTIYTHGTGSGSTIHVPLEPLRQYHICVTDACGNTACTDAAVGPTPIFIDTTTVYDTVCNNSPITLSCSGGMTYKWYWSTNTNGTIYSTAPTYTTPAITQNRIFTVVATRDTLGTTWTNEKHFYISPEPLPSLTVYHTDVARNLGSYSYIAYVCNGDSVHLQASSNRSVLFKWGDDDYSSTSTYAFFPNQADTTNPPATSTLLVSVRSTTPRQCTYSRTITVRSYRYPTLNSVPDTSICTGQSIALRSSPRTISGVRFWYTHIGNNTAKGFSSTGYWTDTVSRNRTYVIHAATRNSFNNFNNYAVSCETTDTVQVTLLPLPTLTATASPQPSCSGETVTLTGGGASSYVWKKGSSTIATTAVTTVSNTNTSSTAASNVTYQLQGTDSHGCQNTTNLTLNVHSVPTVSLGATPSPLCVGGSVTLTATGARHVSWDSTTWNSTAPFTHSQQLNTTGSATLYAWGYNTLARCNSRGQTQVSVLAFPTVHVTADADSVCAGTSTTLRLSGAYEYSLGDTLHFSTATTYTVTPTGTGTTYIVYGRNSSHMCVSSTTIRVGVLALPTVTLSADRYNICQGDSVTLTATGGSSYNWYVGNTLLAQHGDNVTLSPSSSTRYAVEGITSGTTPCSTRQQVDITVYPYPVLTAMSDTGVCLGNTLILRGTPSGVSQVAYWYTSSGTSTPQGRGNSAQWTVTPTDTTDYIIHASRGPADLCQVADTVHVLTYPLPVVTTAASPANACSGETVTLSASGADLYVWKRGSTVIGTSATTQVTNNNSNATSASTIIYQAQGTDSRGCTSAASTVQVHVHSIPTVRLTANHVLFCEGDGVTLTATNARNLSWDSLSFTPVAQFSPRQETLTEGLHTFHVWGYNTLQRCGSRDSVTVQALPYPVVSATTEADSVCPGHSTTLHFHGAYEYSLGDTTHFSTDTTHTVTPTGTGTTYTIYGRNSSHLCINSTTVRVGVMPLPTVTIAASDTVICAGASVTLVSSGGASRNWFADGTELPVHGDTIVVTPTANTLYTVEGITNGYLPCSITNTLLIQVFDYPVFAAMPDTGVCSGDAVTLYATPRTAADTWWWYTRLDGNGSALGMGNIAQWSFIPTDSSDYVIHASHGPGHLCQTSDTVHVDRFPLPTLSTLSLPPAICSGDTATLIASGAQQYVWSYNGFPISPQQGGQAKVSPTNLYVDSSIVNYSLYATDSNQCHNTAIQQVVVHSVPSISLHLPQNEFCLGDNLSRTATGARYYSWDSVNWLGPYTNAYTSNILLNTAGPDTLHLWGYNSSHACTDHAQQSIEVFNYPIVRITPSADTICAGDSVTLTLSGAAQYSVNGSTFSTQDSYTFSLGATTTFIARGRLVNGLCEDADTVTIHVLSLPTIAVAPSAAVICQGDSITLTASNSGTGGASGFLWYNASTNTLLDNDSNASHRVSPDATTTYRVVGITEGNVRCRNVGETLVTVFQRPTLSVNDDTALCHHQTITLRASATSNTPAVHYTYQGNGRYGSVTRTTASSQVSWSFPADSTGTQHYVIGASTGPDSLCRIYDTVEVLVRPLPAVSLSPNHYELCDRDTLVLTGTGASTYFFGTTPPSSLLPSSVSTFSEVPTVGAHLYTLYGDDVYGCRNSDTSLITVYGYPATHLVSNFYDICHGSTVALTASGAQHYSWNNGNSWRNAQPATGIDTMTRILYDSITLYVDGYNLSPLCQVRDSVRIRVYSYPVMTWVADTDEICLNDTVHLTATGAVEYSFDNGTTWVNANTIDYVPALPQTYTYGVIGRSEGPGCQTPLNINVQVHPLPNLQVYVSNSAFCIDTTITISATGGERYRLYEDTDTLPPSYEFLSLWQRQPDSTTNYIVECLTHFNCYARYEHSVEVWTGRFRLFCEDTVVCEHGHVAVSAQGMRYYFWNGDTIPDTHNVYIFTVDTSSDFTVLGTDPHGCHGQETLHVDVYPNPHLQLSADTLGTCVGGTVNIQASGAGEYIYHWDNTVPTVDSTHPALVTDTSWFYVTGIEGNLRCQSTDSIQIIAYPLPPVSLMGDRRDICDRDTLTLIASGADRYSWVEGTPYLSANTRADVPVADSVYLVWGEEDTYHCRNYDTTAVRWFGHPAVSLSAERTKICQGDSVRLTFGNAPFYDFHHSGTLTTANTVTVRPDSTTLYHLHANLRNPRFCGSDTTLLIEVFPIPDIQASVSDTEICFGDTVTFHGTGGAFYAWQGLPATSADDTTHYSVDSLRIPLYRSTTMYLSGTIPNRLCYNHDSVRVTVYDPRVRLNPQAWEICNGGSLIISASGSDRYRWTDNGTFTDSTSHTYLFTGNGTTSSQTFIHVAGETANHLCQSDTTISIVVYPGPNIHLTIEDVDSIGPRTWEVCAGDSVMFFASGGYFYQFPGQTDATRPVRHRYHPQPLGPDTSVYVLYGENFNHQCSGYDSLTIIVNPLPDVSLDASRLLVCEGDTLRLSASGASQYSWFGPGAYGTDTTRIVTVDQTTQFLLWGRDNKLCRNYDTLTVTAFPFPQVHLTASADTLCQGFSTTLTATGGTAYAWTRDFPHDSLFGNQNTLVISPLHDTVVYVWGNNFNGLCATLDSILITVLPVPTVQIVADRNAICWGDTAHLSAICSETAWAWENGAYGSGGLDVTPHDSTWYHVTTRAANGCYAYDSILVEVRPFFNVRLHGDTNVCSGDSLWLSASGSTLYAWGSDTSFGTLSGRFVRPLHDTLVIVRGTLRDSVCRVADTLPIHVHQRPNLYVDPETTTVCLGDSIVLSASGCEQYLWMDETEYGLHNGYHVYWPQQSMTYIVTGSMPGGVCVVTAPIEMIVIDTPMVQFSGPLDICLGDSVRLTASGGERYAWQGGSVFSSSGYFHDLPDSVGAYTYRVTSRVHTLNCTGRASVQVNVHPVPVLTLTVDDSVLCFGEGATLTASGAYQYSWNMGSSYSQANQMHVEPAQTTLYTVYATDSMMLCADTQSLAITVHPLPSVLLSPDTTEFCLGGGVTLTASGADAYAWIHTNPLDAHFSTLTSQQLTPQHDTVANVWGVDSNGCINRDSVYITLHTPFQAYQNDAHHVVVHRYPTVTATIDHAQICLGDDVSVTAAGAQHYRWLDYNGSVANPLPDTPSLSRTYTVEGRMDYGCPDTATASVEVFLYPPVSLRAADTLLCEGDTLHLFASGAPRYSWLGSSAFGTDSLYHVVPPVGTHTLVVDGATDNLLCASSDTVRVTVYPYPDMTIHGAVRWCEGSEVMLSVENPADTLWWTSTPADATLAGQEHADILRLYPSASTLYHLRGKSHICAVEMDHQVEIVPYPRLSLNVSDDRICIGDTVLLTATGGELYSWQGLPSGAATYTTHDSLRYRPQATGFFPVVATTYDTLCSVTDSVFIFVDTVPVMSISGSDSGCIGRTITLEAHTEVPVIWTSEPYDPALDTQSSMLSIVVSPATDIRYTITGYSGRCMGSASHQVTTGIIPRAKGASLPNRVRRGEADIELINQSSHAEGFYWLFPDSSTRFGDHHHYQIPPSYLADTFIVKVVAYLGGCADTFDIPIVLFNDEVWVSNVFTPDEETNNRFFVPLLNKTNFHVEIFNRRGLKVYESDDPDEGWDGRCHGELCPQATYVYRIRTSPKNSKETHYQYGTVTLLR